MNNTVEDKEKLEYLRHSTSHLLAAAVKNLYPKAKQTLGPAIENGFYYDFDDLRISEEDLPKIEDEMHKIVKGWKSFEKTELPPDKAKEAFKGNIYKAELIDEHSSKGENISIYKSGDFVDLCGGGHVDKPNENIRYFKLLSIAGAYWRGSEKNKMLTRIYGTAFFTKKELEEHLVQLDEAEKNNHRYLGKELELFAIFPEIGQGLPVWLPKGYAIRRALEDYMIKLERKYNYQHILTPHINKEELFKISGHLGFYDDSMYSPIEIEDQRYYLKPMNCPAGMMVYKMKSRSYRDLPIKLGEFGTVYRYEKSGELHGLQRVRGFTQNDAHIFCSKEQLVEQMQEVIDMMLIFYKDLGFKKYKFVLALSDSEKEKYKFCGSREGWKQAENTLRKVLQDNKLEYEEQKGEAAFYGPKIDVLAVNVYGKADAISTVQIDFNLPERFGLSFIADDGKKEQPFVIHRALVGSFERFFAFLIEYYKGAFPLWFSPVQVKVLPISEKSSEYSLEVFEKLKDENIKVEIDQRNETLGSKIRDAQREKVNYMLVIGEKEQSNASVSVRARYDQSQEVMQLSDFIVKIKNEIDKKAT